MILDTKNWNEFRIYVNYLLTDYASNIYSKLPKEELFEDLIFAIFKVNKDDDLHFFYIKQDKYVWARFTMLYIHYRFYKFEIHNDKNQNLYNKDHLTIAYALTQVEQRLNTDKEYRKLTAAIWVIWNLYPVPFPKDFPIEKVRNLFKY